jgi:hypothetical protein
MTVNREAYIRGIEAQRAARGKDLAASIRAIRDRIQSDRGLKSGNVSLPALLLRRMDMWRPIKKSTQGCCNSDTVNPIYTVLLNTGGC